MENQTLTTGATSAPEMNQPTADTPNPLKKVMLALVALLVVGGVGATIYLNAGTPAKGDPNEPPPSLTAATGGLKGSFVETLQGFLQYEDKDITAFASVKPGLVTKFGTPGIVKGNATINYMTVNADGLTMADFVNNNNPGVSGNHALFLVYSAGQGGLSKGFHTYPAGPFGRATTEIKKDDLSKITLARNSGVIMISRSDTENYGVLDPSVAPTGTFAGPFLPDDVSGWVLVSGNGKLSDLIGTSKDRMISAWALKDPTTFEKVDMNTYTFGTFHIAWLNLLPKSAVTNPTQTAVAPKITSITPATSIQGRKTVPFIISGTDLAGATVSFNSPADFQNVTGLVVDTTGTSIKFVADISETATPGTKEIKVTTAAGSVTDNTFKVNAKEVVNPLIGQMVLAHYNFPGTTPTVRWFPAKITAVKTDATKGNLYSYTFTNKIVQTGNVFDTDPAVTPGESVVDDYEVNIAVPADAPYLVNERNLFVIVKYKTSGGYWNAKLNSINADGSYNITYLDDNSTVNVPLASIYKPMGAKVHTETEKETFTFIPGLADMLKSTSTTGISNKGTDTSAPRKLTFLSPNGTTSISAADIRKSGLPFVATDTNTKSFLKDDKGNYYMNYKWSLSRQGGTTIWSSGWENTFPEPFTMYGKTATCVMNVNKPTGGRTEAWTCPAGIIPASKLQGLTAGTYIVTGEVGDGKIGSGPVSVAFKVTDETAVPAGTVTAKTTTDDPLAVTFTYPKNDQTFLSEMLKATGLALAVTDPNTKSYNQDAAGKFYMNYMWELKDASGKSLWSTGWTYDASKMFVPPSCLTTFKGETVQHMTCPGGTIPTTAFKDIAGGDYTVIATVGDGHNGKSTSVTIKVIGAAVAASDPIVNDLKKMKISMNPLEINSETGDTKISFKFDQSEMDANLYDDNKGGTSAHPYIQAFLDEKDVSILVNKNQLYETPSKDMQTLYVRSGSISAPKGPCMSWENDSGTTCTASDKYLPYTPMQIKEDDDTLKVKRNIIFPFSDKAEHKIKLVLTYKDQVYDTRYFTYKQGDNALRIAAVHGDSSKGDKEELGYTYCHVGCGNQRFTVPGNKPLNEAYQGIKISNLDKASTNAVIRVYGDYLGWGNGWGYETNPGLETQQSADPLMSISKTDIEKYQVGPSSFSATGESITLYVPTTAMSKSMTLKTGQVVPGYGKPNMLKIFKDAASSTPLASYPQ